MAAILKPRPLVPWSVIAADPEVQKLNATDYEGLRRDYFDRVVAPELPTEEIPTMWEDFNARTGRGFGGDITAGAKRLGLIGAKIAPEASPITQPAPPAAPAFGDEPRARAAAPVELGPWPSLEPATGDILKGRAQPSLPLTEEAETVAGKAITQVPTGRPISQPPAPIALPEQPPAALPQFDFNPEERSAIDGLIARATTDAGRVMPELGAVEETELAPPIERRGAPVTEETYRAIKHAYEAAAPEQRAQMIARADWRGSVAKAVDKMYQSLDEQRAVRPELSAADTRVEARAQRYRDQGADLNVARNMAQVEMQEGVRERPLATVESWPVDEGGMRIKETVTELARSMGEGVAVHLPASIARLAQGMDVSGEGISGALIRRSEELSQARADERDGPSAIPGFSMRDLRELGQNIGFSVTAMGAGLIAGIPATLLGNLAVPVVGTAAGYASGMTAAGTAAFRMDANMVTRQLKEAADEESWAENGRAQTPEEWQAKLEQMKGEIQKHALFEAIPEAVGSGAGFLILTTAAKIFGKGVVARFGTKLLSLYGEETLTETVTQMGQQRAEVRMGLRPGEAEREWTDPAAWAQSAKEVWKQVFLLTTLTAGAVKGGQIAYQGLAGRREGVDVPIEPGPSIAGVPPEAPQRGTGVPPVPPRIEPTLQAELPLPAAAQQAQQAQQPAKPAPEAPKKAEIQPEVTPTVADIHDLATRNGIAWDNDPDFMALTERVTGKRHLDELTPGQREAVFDRLVVRPAAAPGREHGLPTEAEDVLAVDQPAVQQKEGRGGARVPIQPEMRAEAVRLYQTGKTQEQVATELGISDTIVLRALRDAGVASRPFESLHNKKPAEVKDEAIRLYRDEKMTVAEVAQRMQVGLTTAARWMKEVGVQRTQAEALAIAAGKGRRGPRGLTVPWQSEKTGQWEFADSKWEAVRMSQLDTDNDVRSWTKLTERVPYVDAAGKQRSYLPDFIVEYEGGRSVVEEIKPAARVDEPDNVAKAEAARKYFGNKGIEYRIVTEEHIGTEDIEAFTPEGFAKITEAERDRRRLDRRAKAARERRAQKVDEAAHEAATSPLNGTEEPSKEEIDAGNYRKGHIDISGLDISIENPVGSDRKGIGEDGKPWSARLAAHYGYIRRTDGADGDHVDVFIGNDHGSDKVYVVDQRNPKTGKFDEGKVLLSFASRDEALNAYRNSYTDNANKRILSLSETNVAGLKEWIERGDTKKPFDLERKNVWTAQERSAPPKQGTDVSALAEREGSVPESEKPGLPQLRGQRDSAVPGVGGELSGIQGGSRPATESGAQSGPEGQQRPLPAGQRAVGDQQGASPQHAEEQAADAQRGDEAADRMGRADRLGTIDAAVSAQARRDDRGAGVDNGQEKRSATAAQSVIPTPEEPLKAYKSADRAKLEAQKLTRLGAPSKVVPHPTEAGKFAVVEREVKPRSESQKANDARLRQERNTVNAERDSLHTAIGKLGGMDRAKVKSEWDVGDDARPNSEVIGKPVLKREGGLTIDGMMEALAQYGYLKLDENGKYDMTDFEEKFRQELFGEPVYTPQGYEETAAIEAQARHEEAPADADLPADLEPAVRTAAVDLITDIEAQVGADELETIKERVAIEFEDATDEEFAIALRQELENEIATRGRAAVERKGEGEPAQALSRGEEAGDQRGGARAGAAPGPAPVQGEVTAPGQAPAEAPVAGTTAGTFAVPEEPQERPQEPVEAGTRKGTPAPQIVKRYPSVEGVEIQVIKNDTGYTVTMQDTDSGNYLPTLRMFPGREDALAKAIAYAKSIEKKAAPALPGTGLEGLNNIELDKLAVEGSRNERELAARERGRRRREPVTEEDLDLQPARPTPVERPAADGELKKPFTKKAELEQARRSHQAVAQKLQGQGGAIEMSPEMRAELNAELAKRGIKPVVSASVETLKTEDDEGAPGGFVAEEPATAQYVVGEVSETKGRPETAAREPTPTTGDLFATIPLPGTALQGVETWNFEPRRTGTLRVGFDRIDTVQKAAHAFAAIRKSPREQFQMIVTDGQNRPLAAMHLFSGAIAETGIYPEVVMKAIYQTPGAKAVWMAHNHPSGVPKPSHADEQITQVLAQTLGKDFGIQFKAHIVIAGTQARVVDTPGRAFDIPPAARTFSIPIMERTATRVGKPGPSLSSPNAVREFLTKLDPKESGLVLTDAQNRVAGWLPMSLEAMQRLRTGSAQTGAAKFMADMGRINAAGMVVYSPDAKLHYFTTAVANLGALARVLNIKMLDGFLRTGDTFYSMAERGDSTSAPAFFSRATQPRHVVRELKRRFGNEIGELFGVEPEALTAAESEYLIRFRDADTLRARAAAAGAERATRLRKEGVPGPESPLASRAPEAPPSAGLSVSEFRSALEKAFGAKVATRLIDSKIINTIESQSDVPEGVLPFLRRGDTVYGFYYQGKAYAVLESLTAADVKGLAMHEVGTHFGMRKMLGAKKYDQVMKRLDVMHRAGNAAVVEARKLAREGAVRPAQIAEETLAYLVQDHPRMRIVQEIIAAIRAFLFREFGIGADALTEADLTMLARSALRQARMHQRGATGAIAFHKAWHGTAADFDKFDLLKIGTGEGAQAYGWGLYFAGNKEVAEWYRGKFSGSRAFLGIEPLMPEDARNDDEGRAIVELTSAFNDFHSVPEARAGFTALSTELPFTRHAPRSYERGSDVGYWKAVLSGFETLAERGLIFEPDEARLYEVELAPKDDEYLDWDKPLNEQSAKVKAIIQTITHPNGPVQTPIRLAKVGGPTGADIYEQIREANVKESNRDQEWAIVATAMNENAGSAELASKVLLGIGIPGIKYRDADSRQGSIRDRNIAYLESLRASNREQIAKINADMAQNENNPNLLPRYFEARREDIAEIRARIKKLDEQIADLKTLPGVTFNYVLFDDKLVDIEAKFARTGGRESYAKLNAKVSRLEKRVDAAYANNDPKAEELDAQLAELREQLTGTAEEMIEDEVSADIEPAGTEENLVYAYAQYQQGGGVFADRPDAIRNMREALEEGQGQRVTATDTEVLAAAKDAFEARARLRARRPQLPLFSRGRAGARPATAATANSYTRVAKRALAALDRVLDPLGTLPGREAYLKRRYKALGVIARGEEIAAEVRKMFFSASEADKQAVFDYLTTAEAVPDSIAAAGVRAEAVKVKALINSVGDALVRRGLLSEEAREAHRDAYLPRIYLKYLLNEKDFLALGAGKKPSDMGYLKHRKDIPEEVRRVILGEVREPGFLSATAIAKPVRDMALLDWMEDIAGTADWVLPRSVVKWHGQRVSAYWLREEADRLRRQAQYYDPDDATKARAIATNMDDAAEEALAGMPSDRKRYRQIPNTARHGRLRGIWVRKEIYDDITGVNDMMPTEPGFVQSLLGYGGIGTKITQLWKLGKVALNPPAQIRNFVSNGVLLQLSGVALHKVPARVVQAWREIVNDGPHWLIAKKYGVTESTFSAQELYRMKRELLDLENQLGKLGPLGKLHRMAAIVGEKASDLYQFSEALFKTAKIIDEMGKGADEGTAVLEAQKWLFDYSLVHKGVRYARNAPIGMPFLCVDDKTEALTKEGWKGIDQIAEGDMIASFDMKTQRLEWKPVTWVYRDKYDGPMVHIQDRHLDMLMTPHHRCVTYRTRRVPGQRAENAKMLSLEIAEARNLTVNDHIPVAARFDREPEGQPLSDALVKVLGWVATEGWFHNRCAQVKIYQNAGNAQPIRDALLEAGMTWSEALVAKRVNGNDACVYFSVHAEHGRLIRELLPNKQLTPALLHRLTSAQIDILIETMIDGDGCRSGSQVAFIQNKGETVEAFKMALVMAGRSFGVHDRKEGTQQITIRDGKRYCIKRGITEDVPYSGRIWCPEVPGFTTWVARRDDKVFITGNTFQVKVLPRLLETAALHPQRFLPWAGLLYGMAYGLAAVLDVDEDDLEKLKQALPEWIRDRGHAMLLPWKDEDGRWQVLDLGYYFPWTYWTELAANLARGDMGKAVTGAGLFSGPVTALITAAMTGRDSFTDREISNPADPPQRQLASMLNYLWTLSMPPIITDYGAAGHAVRAFTGETNRYGDPRSSYGQAALRAFGVNVYALEPEQTRNANIRRMQFEIEDTMQRLKQRLEDRALSEESRKKLRDEYAAEMKRRMEALREYMRESEINPKLKQAS